LQNLRSPAALARFALTTAIGLGLDLWTKAYAFTHLGKHDTYFFLRGLLDFKTITNQGAVFGWGQGRRWLFICISVAAILFLSYLFATSGRQRLYQFILGLLLAGVLGNMYDRVTLGYVRDMIWAGSRWPRLFPYIFNVADVMLCCGVGLMVLYSLFHNRRSRGDRRGFDVIVNKR
jgi:signal peptidase II